MIRRTTTDGVTLSPLTVDPRGDRLLRDGQPLFLLADTLWAAFSRMSDTEWAEALRLRRRQGFNAVNVSVLPIAHDRSLGGDGASPFAVRANGSWDLDTLDPDYFARARAMVTLAQELGLTAVLVILWCNYVPGTWGSQRTPELAMDDAQTGRYVDLVLETFADLAPIWCVSGDDSLDDPVALSRYRSALRQLRRGAPQCLTTATPRWNLRDRSSGWSRVTKVMASASAAPATTPERCAAPRGRACWPERVPVWVRRARGLVLASRRCGVHLRAVLRDPAASVAGPAAARGLGRGTAAPHRRGSPTLPPPQPPGPRAGRP